jgi:hypothetical protein
MLCSILCSTITTRCNSVRLSGHHSRFLGRCKCQHLLHCKQIPSPQHVVAFQCAVRHLLCTRYSAVSPLMPVDKRTKTIRGQGKTWHVSVCVKPSIRVMRTCPIDDRLAACTRFVIPCMACKEMTRRLISRLYFIYSTPQVVSTTNPLKSTSV